MKISLNWVFDHIQGELSRINVADLVSQFIKTTAEIEAWKKVTVDLDKFTVGEVINITADAITVHSIEHNKNYTLAPRSDAVVGSWYLIYEAGGQKTWATSIH